jgi:hypothetical protein
MKLSKRSSTRNEHVETPRNEQAEAVMRDIEAGIAEIVSDILMARVAQQGMALSKVVVRRPSRLAKRAAA